MSRPFCWVCMGQCKCSVCEQEHSGLVMHGGGDLPPMSYECECKRRLQRIDEDRTGPPIELLSTALKRIP